MGFSDITPDKLSKLQLTISDAFSWEDAAQLAAKHGIDLKFDDFYRLAKKLRNLSAVLKTSSPPVAVSAKSLNTPRYPKPENLRAAARALMFHVPWLDTERAAASFGVNLTANDCAKVHDKLYDIAKAIEKAELAKATANINRRVSGIVDRRKGVGRRGTSCKHDARCREEPFGGRRTGDRRTTNTIGRGGGRRQHVCYFDRRCAVR